MTGGPTEALRVIRTLCDMDRDERHARFGDDTRALLVIIPAIVDNALGDRPMSDPLRRELFDAFTYLAATPAADSRGLTNEQWDRVRMDPDPVAALTRSAADSRGEWWMAPEVRASLERAGFVFPDAAPTAPEPAS